MSCFVYLALGLLKRKKPPYSDDMGKAARNKASKSQLRIMLKLANSLERKIKNKNC